MTTTDPYELETEAVPMDHVPTVEERLEHLENSVALLLKEDTERVIRQ